MMIQSPMSSPRPLMLGTCLMLIVGCSSPNNDAFKTAEPPEDAGGADTDATDAQGDVQTAVDPSIAEAQDEMIEAECDMLYRCCSSEELEDRFGIDGSSAECDDFQSPLPVTIHLANMTESDREGRISFDPGMAELCGESYLDQDCSQWTALDPSTTTLSGCMEMVTPQVNEGGDCKFDFECVSSFCEMQEDDDEMGKCVGFADEGDTCFGADCGDGLYCDTFDDACLPQKDDGRACVDDDECKSGACTSDSEGQMQCSPPAPLCNSFDDDE